MVIRLAVAASIIALFIIIYALVDCLRTPPYSVRSISKPAWVLSILLLPLIGAGLWFALGRPRGGVKPDPYSAPGSSSRSSAPDDDAAFPPPSDAPAHPASATALTAQARARMRVAARPLTCAPRSRR